MRVIGVNRYGGPEALEVVEVEEPHAGPGEVRVAVRAAAVSPTDTFVRNGDRAEQQRVDPPPYVPGMDAAGVVDEVGEGVEHVEVGQDVMAVVVPKGSHGAYAENVVLPADSVAAAPAGASYAEASTLPMNGLTARLALDRLALEPGDAIAVTGAAGAFGGYVVQLARADGLRVVADASDADVELVRGLGAETVLPRGDGFAARVREVVPDGVDALADGALLGEAATPAVRDGGQVATIRGWDGTGDADARTRGLRFHPVWIVDYARERGALDRLRRQAEDRVVTLRVADELPAEQAPEAHRRLEAGGVRGRLVLRF